MQLQQQRERGTTDSNSSNDSNSPTGSLPVNSLPTALDSPRTKLVYLYLSTAEAGTVEEVRDALGMELISLYPVLSTLTSEGLVRKDGSHYVCSDA